MSLKLIAINCVLLAIIVGEVQSAVTTVRPYKFGFTIDEQQHRAEKRDERGIVMGEFGFITADGIYHVTVYATDEDGKFRIISMKSYPYAGPLAVPAITTTTSTSTTTKATPLQASLPKYNFNTEACSGCFLKKTPVPTPVPKTEIRTLSQPLPPSAETDDFPDKPSSSGVAAPALTGTVGANTQTAAKTPITSAVTATRIGSPLSGGSPANVGGSRLGGGNSLGGTKPGAGTNGGPSSGGSPVGGANGNHLGGGGSAGGNRPTSGISAGSGGSRGASATISNETGDLYKFKYLLDYNGHEETGSRNGDKQGNYFAIGEDSVLRTIEYIANEFGYQPHVSWQKLDTKDAQALPEENSLKHYEFKWFNKAE
ncbi:protein lethal(3)malignant blood neoplasm 1 [Drosophila willistoni]|uniref:protein lethal(3)malignant blood neoplasm 1 n=1 Tax=Drosophila willistoni TaxID=7260 RepID=UPI000C26CCC1|nr:protein lethal(3)malignant blood neoplasm 1 [Drosophila willistoni]